MEIKAEITNLYTRKGMDYKFVPIKYLMAVSTSTDILKLVRSYLEPDNKFTQWLTMKTLNMPMNRIRRRVGVIKPLKWTNEKIIEDNYQLEYLVLERRKLKRLESVVESMYWRKWHLGLEDEPWNISWQKAMISEEDSYESYLITFKQTQRNIKKLEHNLNL